MRPRFAATALAIVYAAGMHGAEPAAGWRTDYSQALYEAQATGKLVVVNIHTEWCAPCRRLQQTTLRDPALWRILQEECVAVSLDGDRSAVARQLGVSAYPTQLFLAPDGALVGRLEGYVDAARYTAALRQAQRHLAARGTPRPRPSEGAPPTSGIVSRLTPATAKPAAPPTPSEAAATKTPPAVARETTTPQPPLALAGYCPVTMMVRAELVAGDPRISAVYQGRRYHFVSTEARRRFLADPEPFLPAEGGRCVVTWAERRLWQMGAIEFPALFEDHLYLFPTEAQRTKFLRDPERYVDRSGRAFR